jgi:hypothetical protein
MMRKIVITLLTGAILAGGASSAYAGPEDVIRWLKDPCVPTGDLEDDCRLPNPLP